MVGLLQLSVEAPWQTSVASFLVQASQGITRAARTAAGGFNSRLALVHHRDYFFFFLFLVIEKKMLSHSVYVWIIYLSLLLRDPSTISELLHRACAWLFGGAEWEFGDRNSDWSVQWPCGAKLSLQHHTWDHSLLPQRLLPEQAGVSHCLSGWGAKNRPCQGDKRLWHNWIIVTSPTWNQKTFVVWHI